MPTSYSISRDIRRGEIYYVCKAPITGSEQESGRPALVVSSDAINKSASVVEVVYLTTQPKNDSTMHVVTYATGKESTILCEQITTVDKSRFSSFYTTLSPDKMKSVDYAILCSMGLSGYVHHDSASKAHEESDEYCEADAQVTAELKSAQLEQELTAVTAECKVYKDLYDKMLDRLINGGKQ